MLEYLTQLFPVVGAVFAVPFLLWATYWILIRRHQDIDTERKFSRQLIMLGLTILGLLAFILLLPISDNSRNQLLGIIGIVISGIIAFSSTTIVSNLMSGVILRITNPFRVGDFIRIGEYFGRVSERGLLDTEIQTETRDLISLPNAFCIKNPVTTTRSSGTIISASLSLGYDLDHNRIEQLLIEAALSCDLKEPFVHILELGNFAVTYRVSGFLEESKKLISVRSRLHGCVLDTLHRHSIEIMSPTYMNQRQLHNDIKVIPDATKAPTHVEQVTAAEEIAFDKAELAEHIENEKYSLSQEVERLQQLFETIEDEQQKKALKETIQKLKKKLQTIENEPESAIPNLH